MYFPDEIQTFDSHLMIEIFMLWTNHLMAQELDSRFGYGIFRSHPAPYSNQKSVLNNIITKLGYKNNEIQDCTSDFTREQLIQFTQGIPGNHNKIRIKTFQYLLKDIMRKASYEAEASNHYALGFVKYLHFTSPIRRAADLINHCILRGFTFTDQELQTYLGWINEAETIQLNIEKTLSNYDFLRLLINPQHIEREFSGLIIDINNNGIKVFIPEIEHTCYLHVSKLSKEKLFFDNLTKNLYNQFNEYQILNILKVKYSKMDYDLNRMDWNI